MTCQCFRDKWTEQREELAGRGFEVGWSYPGHASAQEKKDAVQEMLARHGDDPELWLLAPQIREQHIEGAIEDPFERRLTTITECAWAVYGVLAEKPEVGHILEGQHIPLYGFREYDRG